MIKADYNLIQKMRRCHQKIRLFWLWILQEGAVLSSVVTNVMFCTKKTMNDKTITISHSINCSIYATWVPLTFKLGLNCTIDMILYDGQLIELLQEERSSSANIVLYISIWQLSKICSFFSNHSSSKWTLITSDKL